MGDRINEILDRLLEGAYRRKKAEAMVEDNAYQILLHLIKILHWEDRSNYAKHIRDLNAWLYRVQRPSLKGRNKRLSARTYYRLLWDEPVGQEGIADLRGLISHDLKKYGGLPVIRSDEDVLNKLEQVYSRMCRDLSENAFDDIVDYL